MDWPTSESMSTSISSCFSSATGCLRLVSDSLRMRYKSKAACTGGIAPCNASQSSSRPALPQVIIETITKPMCHLYTLEVALSVEPQMPRLVSESLDMRLTETDVSLKRHMLSGAFWRSSRYAANYTCMPHLHAASAHIKRSVCRELSEAEEEQASSKQCTGNQTRHVTTQVTASGGRPPPR